jgi:DNA-directed RNA polymerase subunit RPC12/RpoP
VSEFICGECKRPFEDAPIERDAWGRVTGMALCAACDRKVWALTPEDQERARAAEAGKSRERRYVPLTEFLRQPTV